MARSGKTAQEFIQNSFSPIIAVLCSPKVDNIVCKNNLSFPELLQPFTTVDWEGQFREPGGSTCTIKNWKLVVRDVNWKPLQPTEARKQLNNAVLHNYSDKTVSIDIDGKKIDIPQSTPWFDAWRETYLEVQFPSDHEFTKHFLSCVIVGTTLDDNIVDTFNGLNQQYAQLQNVTPPKLPKWFNSGVLKSYLLLHDVSCVMKEKADAMFETLKQNFGAGNCFMLSINSKSALESCLATDYWTPYVKRTADSNTEVQGSGLSHASSPLEPPPPAIVVSDDVNTVTISTNADAMHPLTTNENDVYDNANSLQTHSFSGSSESMNVAGRLLDYSTEVHGVALNNNDVEAIKQFIHDYASKALLPYLEKQIAQLSELVANKKGVSRSLLSATKRWFGTGKGGNTTGGNTVIYSNDCPELQLRRLGDLWFLCGQWQRAFDTYHTAKREFYADSAWLCYAGALEMAAISAFMAGEANRKTHGYMEESIVTYLNTCRMVQYGVRATLLSVLCLGSSGLHGEAAKQLIRMTSEDSDLRSAMLLEQAALCFLSGPGTRAMCRKYAFHMVLAGHRFSKAGQKKQAYRCYNQAYQVYTGSGWRLSTDHVQFALGRLAGALRLTRDAVSWLAGPLAPAGLQPPRQQEAFLREYMAAHQQWIESSDEYQKRLPVLPLPLLVKHSTAVLCIGPAPLSSPGRQPATSLSLSDADKSEEDNQYWYKMEEMLLQVAQGSVPMIFKPTIDLYTEKTDGNPSVPQGEPIQISVTLENPLKVPLTLKDVELLWQFTTKDEDTPEIPVIINNELLVSTGGFGDSNVIYGEKTKFVILEPDTKKILTFSLTPHKVGALVIQSLAYRLSYTDENGQEKTNGGMITGKIDLFTGSEKRLQISVTPHAPCLQMTFSETSSEAISGEIRSIDVEFRNVGPVEMRNVHVAVSHPDCVWLLTGDTEPHAFSQLYSDKYREQIMYSDERSARAAARAESAQRHVRAAWAQVARGECVRAALLLRPRAPAPRLHLLAYYEPADRPAEYRLLRHVFNFQLHETVSLSVTPRRGLSTRGDEISENMNLVLEVKNICNEKDDNLILHILETSLLSRQWELTDLVASRNKEEPLMSREKQHFVLKAKRIKENLPDNKVAWSCKKIAESHPETKDNINADPYAKFVTDYRSNNDNVEGPINVERPKAGLIQSNVVLRWKIQDKNKRKTAIGQTCLWLECFTEPVPRDKQIISEGSIPLQLDENECKSDVVDSKKKQEDNVVMFRMEHSNQINHNFKERKLCLVPITMNIVNCYGIPVTVFVNMAKQDNRESLNILGWTGALNSGGESGKEVGVQVTLGRFESRRVQVSAVCAAPGSYLLASAFCVTARPAAGPDPPLALTHPANNSTLLVVQQS